MTRLTGPLYAAQAHGAIRHIGTYQASPHGPRLLALPKKRALSLPHLAKYRARFAIAAARWSAWGCASSIPLHSWLSAELDQSGTDAAIVLDAALFIVHGSPAVRLRRVLRPPTQ